MPDLFPGGGLDPVRHQVRDDLPDAVAQQIPGEDAPHHRGLFRIDLRLAVRPLPVPKESLVVVVDLPVLEVLAVAPLHIPAEGLALRLGLAHHKREDHLVVHVEGIDIFLLK